MKLDDDLRLRVLEQVGVYSARLSIPEPRILFATREVLDLPREITEGCRTSAYKYYGVTYFKGNCVFLNVRKIPDEAEMERTVVHELVHLRFPYLSHGRRFTGLVRRTLKGARFAPYKRRSGAGGSTVPGAGPEPVVDAAGQGAVAA
ncbi:MAG: hypothetical protein MPJ05_08225 [Nitrosopumilus sp.]|nr:hypothetical protein [Nitrosopumilus sp.]CAI9832297.1 conserved hypothetical protein [Nitrosopumilaceae archaeon]MDA7945826.1 hypothetical protein [Nitrosopumilus sp.]MDA7953780.1 hypothetical protein [Nitrosopumilus sp.]MDA7954880.1 hypothetical protein [Nitrosopumilus sp.]